MPIKTKLLMRASTKRSVTPSVPSRQKSVHAWQARIDRLPAAVVMGPPVTRASRPCRRVCQGRGRPCYEEPLRHRDKRALRPRVTNSSRPLQIAEQWRTRTGQISLLSTAPTVSRSPGAISDIVQQLSCQLYRWPALYSTQKLRLEFTANWSGVGTLDQAGDVIVHRRKSRFRCLRLGTCLHVVRYIQ